jgi:hypothetical protein
MDLKRFEITPSSPLARIWRSGNLFDEMAYHLKMIYIAYAYS